MSALCSASYVRFWLRLLLALGHQIGMAVENSYLIQQTARRSEELHILNEIGRALSSTLEPDALFERIYSEMQRLLDVKSLFIAFYDRKSEQIRFEIEVIEGVPVVTAESPSVVPASMSAWVTV